MDTNNPNDPELIRFRSEAAELLGVDPKNQPAPSTAPATSKSPSPEK